jgi:hypothetical protein
MKLSKNYVQTFIFIAVYLFAIYFWTQPLRARGLPYGEFDAMSHFEVADYMAYNDRSFLYLPDYIDIRYGGDNAFKPHTLWYPPTFHSTLGVMEVIGGERVVPVFLMNTILATFIIITVYFVINSLFGFFPAILSSLLLIFSPRDFMPFLWGQWPERFAYAFVPIIIYCFYRYLTSYSRENNKPIYIYLCSLFLGIVLLVHPLVFFHSVIGLGVLYLFLSIKLKKFFFNWKQISIAALIFFAVFLLFPYQTFNIFPQFNVGGVADGAPKGISLTRLFQWSLDPEDFLGSVPASYFSFRDMHGLWTMPFLLLGIVILAIRRENRDIFLLAWLVSLYIVLHRDIIGIEDFLHRSLSASAHIFAPLTAVGAVYLSSIFKLPSNYSKYVKYVLVAAFVFFALSINMKNSSTILNEEVYNPNSQSGFFTTLSNEQFQAAQWILDKVPEEYNISVMGIPHQDQFITATAKKIRWFAAVSQHVNRFHFLRNDQEEILQSEDWYILLDYTMLGAINDQETFDRMQDIEKTALANHTLVYDQNNIRVYKLGPNA